MSRDFLELAVPGVKNLNPYQPGKAIEVLAREQSLEVDKIVKLGSNENPLGPSPSVVSRMTHVMGNLARYPDGSGFKLKQALSEHLAVNPEQIILGNGSNDVLVLLAQAFLDGNSSGMYSEFGFVVYSLAVRAVGARTIVVPADGWKHDLSRMAEEIRSDTRMIFLANPNNPTGTSFSVGELETFMANIPPDVIVVLDEAYFEYAASPEFPDGVKLLSVYSNLVVTRTFSKAYGMAGARVGYCVSNIEIADILNRIRQPFNVNLPGLAGAEAALNDKDYLNRSIELNKSGMKQVEQGLSALGLSWIPSAGNFITVNMQTDAVQIYQALLTQGIIVRPVVNYGMPKHLRISIGLPKENQLCLDALKRVLSCNVGLGEHL